MSEISVILPVCNHEKYVHDTIKSILNQSFEDFELILADDGSTNDSLSVVKSFEDSRIRIIARNDLHNRTNALNAGIESASGKYIAMMEANHIMHVDRLKIQHAFMEAEPSITVCSAHIKYFDAQKQENNAIKLRVPGGLIENPLLFFLSGNCIIHPTVMIRNQFLKKHQLLYENYPDAENFKLWTEIAKRGGQFHMDTQQLQYGQVTNKQDDGLKRQSSDHIINEIVEFLAKRHPELEVILANFKKLQDKETMTHLDIVGFFHHFFTKNKDKL